MLLTTCAREATQNQKVMEDQPQVALGREVDEGWVDSEGLSGDRGTGVKVEKHRKKCRVRRLLGEGLPAAPVPIEPICEHGVSDSGHPCVLPRPRLQGRRE